MFVNPVGFSNGWAPPTPYMLPPLVPSSLMTSIDATGPPGICCVPPARVAASRNKPPKAALASAKQAAAEEPSPE